MTLALGALATQWVLKAVVQVVAIAALRADDPGIAALASRLSLHRPTVLAR